MHFHEIKNLIYLISRVFFCLDFFNFSGPLWYHNIKFLSFLPDYVCSFEKINIYIYPWQNIKFASDIPDPYDLWSRSESEEAFVLELHWIFSSRTNSFSWSWRTGPGVQVNSYGDLSVYVTESFYMLFDFFSREN